MQFFKNYEFIQCYIQNHPERQKPDDRFIQTAQENLQEAYDLGLTQNG